MKIRKIFWMVAVILVLVLGFSSESMAEKIMVVPCGVAIAIPDRVTEDGMYYCIGTLTFIQPEGNYFVALGHGIHDTANDKLINLTNLKAYQADITNVEKEQGDNFGYLDGKKAKEIIGTIQANTLYGVYGQYNRVNKIVYGREAIPVAEVSEIQLGKATILCTLDGKTPKEYEIEIVGAERFIDKGNNYPMLIIQATDEELIEKTGGFVPGMSGSPILQNGKFIGALYGQIGDHDGMGAATLGIDMVIR